MKVTLKFDEEEWAAENGVSGHLALEGTDGIPIESDVEDLLRRLGLSNFTSPGASAGAAAAAAAATKKTEDAATPNIMRFKWLMPYERPHLCAILPGAKLPAASLDPRALARALGSHRPRLTMGELRSNRRRQRQQGEAAMNRYAHGGGARRLGDGGRGGPRDWAAGGPGGAHSKRQRIGHDDNRWTMSGRPAMGIGRERAPVGAPGFAPNRGYVRPGQHQRTPWQEPPPQMQHQYGGYGGGFQGQPPPPPMQPHPQHQQQHQRGRGGAYSRSDNASAAAALRRGGGAPPAPPPQHVVYSQGGYQQQGPPQAPPGHVVFGGGGYSGSYAPPPPTQGGYAPPPMQGGYAPPQYGYGGQHQQYAPPPMHMPYGGAPPPPQQQQQQQQQQPQPPPPPAQPFSFRHP